MSLSTPSPNGQWYHGSTVPFAEPAWSRGSPSPYLKDSHRRLRDAMRTWVETHVIPFASEWEEKQTLPKEIYQQAAADGVLMPMAAGKSISSELAGSFPIMGGVKPEEWDGFHDFIIHDELNRVGGIGVPNGLIGGVTLCMPAILKFGSSNLKKRVAKEVFSGQKRLALAITEPDAGSDVQSLATRAVLTPDGKHYKVNGQKKWITGGMYADYFLTLTRTSKTAMTMLLIPRIEGVETRHMKMSGSGSAGTAFLDFDDVLVPVGNVVGEVGAGLKSIISNFNHESLIFQHASLSPEDADLLLAGQIAQLKAHSGIVLQNVVRDAVQILGGIGLTRGGRGERVERLWRDVKAITVPGGSEEIMLELSVKRALRVQTTLEGKSDVGKSKI
ncbi:hypothetical protein VF21_04907 [Pseudogymnoascus sp. 05NY08]|nr:hypothetical protein VF21_04907 [Pseudogymnoascus sp. 05NY08]